MKNVIIVQARMTSTRLPGKVLMTVLGKTLLEYLVERLRRVYYVDEIVVATTINDTDNPIVDLCDQLHVDYYRGPEDDVLARYYGAAVVHNADAIVRITADCPIIDPHIVSKVIEFFINHENQYDYVSNVLKRTYPRGLDTEIFNFRALHDAFSEAQDQREREHVTPFIYRHPERYRLADVVSCINHSRHRWTVDTSDDFELIRRIIEALYPSKKAFNMDDVLAIIAQNPEWTSINEQVRQKEIGT